MRPECPEIVAALPRNVTGKVLKRSLADHLIKRNRGLTTPTSGPGRPAAVQPRVMLFRPAQARDVDALLAVSLATGLAGGDAAHLYQDGALTGLIYSSPYVRLEPALALVVEDDDGVCGFAVGAIDTVQWEARLEREWWPALRALYPRPVGEPSGWSADDRRCAMIHDPVRTPEFVTRSFQAHMHLNLLPRVQGRGVGRSLFQSWLTLGQQHGARSVHVGVNHQNERALLFWARCGFQPVTAMSKPPRTIWMGRSDTEA